MSPQSRGTERPTQGGAAVLRGAVLAMCRDLRVRGLDAELAALVIEVEERLNGPLRVAIGGKVSLGKSTLVNALVGRRVAEVHAGETRRVTTRYLAGTPEQATAWYEDGGSVLVPLPDDGGPLRALDSVRRVARWDVCLESPALEGLMVVDTPGLFSPEAEYSSDGMNALLGTDAADADRQTRVAMREADALIFLIGDAVSESDMSVLTEFRRDFAAWGKSGFNAVALVSKADLLNVPGDPFDAASQLATDDKEQLGATVAGVLPVSSLLAETGATAALGESDLAFLRTLAAEPPSERVLRSLPRIEDTYGDAGRRLTARLGSYGIRFAIEHIGPDGDVEGLGEALLRRSGIGQVRRLIDEHFLSHADIIKAARALDDLESAAQRRLAADPEGANRVLEEVGLARRAPAFHRVREAFVLHQVAQGHVTFGAALDTELERLLIASDPQERLGLGEHAADDVLLAGATDARRRWHAISEDRLRELAARRAATVVLGSLRDLTHDLVDGTVMTMRGAP